MKPPSKKPKPSSSSAGGRVFPTELIFNILSRLPVKSLLRFGNVSDHWRNLTSQEDFKSAHLRRSPSSILIRTQHYPGNEDDYAFYTCTPPNPPTAADFPDDLLIDNEALDIIGNTQNGIVCLSLTNGAGRITLWNPATRSTSTIPSPTITYNPNKHSRYSVGFGYDPTRNDIVIVRILSPAGNLDAPAEAEIYSLKHRHWKTVEFGDNVSRFRVYNKKCEAVINGVPYWESNVVGTIDNVMVSFNPVTMSFNVDPFNVALSPKSTTCYGEIMGCLAVIVWEEEEDGELGKNQFLDIWIRDNQTRLWNKFCRVDPLYYTGRAVGSYGERGIVQEIEDGEDNEFMYAFDFESPETGNKLEFPRSEVLEIHDVVRYKESLYSLP